MKWNIVFTTLFILSLHAAPSSALEVPGYVYVSNGATYSYMYGSFNVGTNPRAGHADSSIRVTSEPSDGIRFSGVDGTDGDTFSCRIYTYSSLYPDARGVAAGISDGGYIYVRKNSSGECDYISMSKPSYFQD